MSKTLQGLKTHLNKARNLSYYGKYSQSISFFQIVQSKIESQIFHISDKILLLEWNKFLEQIKYQQSLIKATCQLLSGNIQYKIPQKQSKQNQQSDQNYAINGNNSSKKLNNGYARQQQIDRKPKLPFGKQPFKKRNHEDDQVYNKKEKQRVQQQEEQFEKQQQQDRRKQQDKFTKNPSYDQDAWQQIFPKQKHQNQNQPTKPMAKKTSIQGQSSSSNHPIYNVNKLDNNNNPSLVNNNRNNNKNRQYQKPWKKNAQKPGVTNDKNNDKEEKKSFLKSCYPDGNGPDTNLIEMLEREVVQFSPNITFDDIAELTKAKQILQQAVLLPLALPQLFKGNRRAWKGVLLFGPPGTGKTLLAKAVASTGATTFFNVTASSLASKWKGQSQKLVRILFEMARFYAPATIFIDQIDSLASTRGQKQDQSSRRVKTQLMTRIDGCTSSSDDGKLITVIGATNRPWDLDDAIRRRLQKRIYIPLPTQIGRKQLLRINLKNQKTQTIDLQQIVKKTQGYSGADIANLCREAAYMPMRRRLKSQGGLGKKLKDVQWKQQFSKQVNIPLTMQDFYQAVKNVKPSVGQGDLKHYMQWMSEFGEQGTQ